MYIDFMGEKGVIRLDYGSLFTYYTEEDETLISYKPNFHLRDHFLNEINAFVGCIKTGEKLASHIDTIIITAEMMQAIYDSAKQHKEMSLI